MRDKLINLGLIILIGGLSGILCSQFVLPWLAGLPLFGSIDWISRAKDGATIINKTEKIVITENEALEEVIDKGSKSVVGITSQNTEKIVGKKKVSLENPEVLSRGTGLIITSDGLIVTAQQLIAQAPQQVLVALGERQSLAQVKKSDKNSGLVLLKINEVNLPVVSFVEEELKLGQPVFLVGASSYSLPGKQEQIIKFVDLSIIKQLLPQLKVDFSSKEIVGSPLFNTKGEVIGINLIDEDGQGRVALSSVIKELLK